METLGYKKILRGWSSTVFASFKNLPAETCYACQADEEVLLGSPDEISRKLSVSIYNLLINMATDL
jgi:hypothetical protein